MASPDVRRFIHGLDRDWQVEQGDTGREELVTLDNGFRVRLTPALDAPLDTKAMVAELEELLGGSRPILGRLSLTDNSEKGRSDPDAWGARDKGGGHV